MSDQVSPPASLSPERQRLLESMLAQGRAPSSSITRRARTGPAPLSYAQERLWFLHRLEPESPAYNAKVAVHLAGPLDVIALRRAIEAIVDRHEILRTRVEEQAGGPVQVIEPRVAVALPLIDLAGLSEPSRAEAARAALVAESHRLFRLDALPLLRTALLRLATNAHLLLIVTHHIVDDGWSTDVFDRELTTLYEAFVRRQASPLPALALQYADYAAWQRAPANEERFGEQLAYWTRQLAGVRPLQLPAARPRSAGSQAPARDCRIAITGAVRQRASDLAKAEGATEFVVLLAAFQTLLWRYCGQRDIAIGSPVANRALPEIQPLIGFFANTLVLRTTIQPASSFRALVRQVRDTAFDALAHQDVPFERVVESVQPVRQADRHPLFQAMFVFQNRARPARQVHDLTLRDRSVESRSAQFDLLLALTGTEAGLEGYLRFRTDLFEPGTVARMSRHFEQLLEELTGAPDLPLHAARMLAEAEHRQLVIDWTRTTRVEGTLLHEQFAAVASSRPGEVAVRAEDRRLTYAELQARASRLAAYLRAWGVGPGTYVGLCVSPSIEMIVGILGILQAGAAYVPLDPDMPSERLALMLADVRAPMLLTEEALLAAIPPHVGKLVCLDTDWATIEECREPAPRPRLDPDDAAYVIFTSGSTGVPKGVTVTHRNVSRLFATAQPLFGFGIGDVWTVFHSHAFDFSVWEIFGALLHGGIVEIVPYWTRRSPEALWALIAERRVTMLSQTPSAFRRLMACEPPAAAASLRWIVFGGEALDYRLLTPWLARHGDAPQLVNMYGITETTVHVTFFPVPPGGVPDRSGSPIGGPLPDVWVYVLDRSLNPVPLDAWGELFVGGPGVARGYVAQPGLTAERFVPDPFAHDAGARIYRTGDVACRRADGQLVFLGRNDAQVKIRGHRLELADIERTLERHPLVQHAAVMPRAVDSQDDVRLVAYLVPWPGEELIDSELRTFVTKRLPGYMVPATFLAIAALPLTTNGKLDRQALPWPPAAGARLVPADSAEAGGDGLAFHGTETERELASIWRELLKVPAVTAEANFFDLGGHSLLVLDLVWHVRERLGVEMSIRTFFDHPTVRALAAQVDDLRIAGAQGTDEAASVLEAPR